MFIKKTIIVPAILLIAGISFSAHAKTIKDLTSKKTSRKLSKQVNEVAKMTGQAINVHAIGIGLGQTFLSGDFADEGADKITADLLYNYSASHSFDFMADFHYSSHEKKKTKSVVAGLSLGIKAKMYNYDAFSPFLVGGFGFYAPRVTRKNSNGDYKETESKLVFGYHMGAGADLDLNSKVRVGLLAILHNPFDIKQEGESDISGSYYKLLLTAYFKF